MGMKQFMAAQLRQPSGWFGTLVMTRMLNQVNRQIVERTLEVLQIQPDHQVLEIGFGGGSALVLAAAKLKTGKATGLDLSPEMVSQAQRKFRRVISEGRIAVQQGDVSRLPVPDATYDRVFTINTIYFWPDTMQGLSEIKRALKPGGLAAIGIRSKEKMEKQSLTKYNFRLFSKDDLESAMKQAGFRDLEIEASGEEHWYDQVIAVGRR
jgi:ubiquinone/menaquinone biosynthesis C-methylase UbiE